MCVNCNCSMSLDEALEIAEKCRSDIYPPTNPYVLLKAAQVIYKEMGACLDLYSILDWAKTVVSREVIVDAG